MILAGDIGGTKSTLMLLVEEQVDSGSAVLRPIFRFHARTWDFPALADLIVAFRSQAERETPGLKHGDISAAVFGCAGAVVEGRVLTTNLPWVVETDALAKLLELDRNRTLLLNDLVATAASVPHMAANNVLQLNHATPQARGTKALIAAGTGLGEALLFWDGTRYCISPSEASLTDFAPSNDHEFELLRSLRQRMRPVCCEEIVSGRGFRVIHQILFPDVPHAWFHDPTVDSAAQITQQALANSCPACVETLQIWVEAYAAEARNMALRILPFGGVYIGGGIATKILPKLKDGTFVRVFHDNDTLGRQLAQIPIYVLLNEDAPVLGAAYEALALSFSQSR
jgi:glucokinase